MKRFTRPATVVLFAAMCVGCDVAPAPPSRPKVGPHGAAMYPLPGGAGFAELVNEPEVTDRRAAPTTAIVAYFFQGDAKSPLSPGPSDVRVVLDQGRKRSESLPLKSDPKSDDPAGGCRFATKLGPYLLEGLRGKLTGTVNGQPFDLSFVSGR
jgi:hypothetical protein